MLIRSVGPGEWQGAKEKDVAVKKEPGDSPKLRGSWGKRLASHSGSPIDIPDSSQSPPKQMKSSSGMSTDETFNIDEAVREAVEEHGPSDAAPPAATASGDVED